MTIFLDYYREKGENISNVAVKDSNSTQQYRFRNITESINLLAGRELIVTFERPYSVFKRSMEGYEYLLDDMQVKEKWYDLHKIIRRETGKAITLSRIVKATLGDPDDLQITRLEPTNDDYFRTDIEPLLDSRLRALQEIFKQAVNSGQLSYQIGDTTEWVELSINENIDLD